MPTTAFATNAAAVRWVAEGCHRVGAHLVHVSTDYVFDGTLDRPYHEWDRPAPRSVYGASKLGGEHEALELGADAAVVRTSWVCGAARLEHGDARAPAGRRAGRAGRWAGVRRRPARLPVVHRRPGADAAARRARSTLRGHPRDEPGRRDLVRVRRVRSSAPSATTRRSCDRSRRPSSIRHEPRPRPANSVLDNAVLRAAGVPAAAGLPRWTAPGARRRTSTAGALVACRPVGFTRAELESFRDATVPDLVGPGLRLLFVGINPGLWTAATQTHFAHPGNRFYPGAAAGRDHRPRHRPPRGLHRRRPPLPRRARHRHHQPRGAGRRHGPPSCPPAELADGGAPTAATSSSEHRPRVVAVAGISAYRHAFALPRAAPRPAAGVVRGRRAVGRPQPQRAQRPPDDRLAGRRLPRTAVAAGIVATDPRVSASWAPTWTDEPRIRTGAFGFRAVGQVPLDGGTQAVLERRAGPASRAPARPSTRRRGGAAGRRAWSDPTAARRRTPTRRAIVSTVSRIVTSRSVPRLIGSTMPGVESSSSAASTIASAASSTYRYSRLARPVPHTSTLVSSRSPASTHFLISAGMTCDTAGWNLSPGPNRLVGMR